MPLGKRVFAPFMLYRVLEPGAFYLMDRGDLDFARLFVIHAAQAFFLRRATSEQPHQIQARYPYAVGRGHCHAVRSDGCADIYYELSFLLWSCPVRLAASMRQDAMGTNE